MADRGCFELLQSPQLDGTLEQEEEGREAGAASVQIRGSERVEVEQEEGVTDRSIYKRLYECYGLGC